MPDERLIAEIETIMNTVVELGAEKERTRMVPNLLISDDSPSKEGFILVQDDRDGDNILAKKVPGIIYQTNDLVNVLFVRGGEAIAFQQGSESANSDIWELVPSTSTDISYDKGQVGIGNTAPQKLLHVGAGLDNPTVGNDGIYASNNGATSVIVRNSTDDIENFLHVSTTAGIVGTVSAHELRLRSSNTDRVYIDTSGNVGINQSGPDARLDVLDSASAQLRLTHTDGTKFVDFTLDTNHDLTITPSSTGQIILQPTTDSVDFFQVLDADGGTPVLNVDSTNERVGIGTASPDFIFDIENSAANWRMRLNGTGVNSVVSFELRNDAQRYLYTVDGTASDIFKFRDATAGADRFIITTAGNVGFGTTSVVNAQLHVDQTSTTAAEPVLLLDQADVSEEFIRFIGTAAAATLTQSIVAEADVTTATRQGFVKVYVQDDGNQITDQDYFVPIFTLA